MPPCHSSRYSGVLDPRYSRHRFSQRIPRYLIRTLLASTATARVPAGVSAEDTQALPLPLRECCILPALAGSFLARRGLIACCRSPRGFRDSEALNLSLGRSVLRCLVGPLFGVLPAVAWPSRALTPPSGMTSQAPPLKRDSSSERSRLFVRLSGSLQRYSGGNFGLIREV